MRRRCFNENGKALRAAVGRAGPVLTGDKSRGEPPSRGGPVNIPMPGWINSFTENEVLRFSPPRPNLFFPALRAKRSPPDGPGPALAIGKTFSGAKFWNRGASAEEPTNGEQRGKRFFSSRCLSVGEALSRSRSVSIQPPGREKFLC